ncbi:hypothetical protein HWV62_40461 [Athelia sp. TMB]|nr:hypothetical protein HWV62_40461 [Athelia sp. TMB]
MLTIPTTKTPNVMAMFGGMIWSLKDKKLRQLSCAVAPIVPGVKGEQHPIGPAFGATCPAPRHPKKSPSNEPVPIENPPIEPCPSDPVTPKAVRSYGKMLSPTYTQKLLRNQFAVEDESSAALREKYRKEAALIVSVKWWTAFKTDSLLKDFEDPKEFTVPVPTFPFFLPKSCAVLTDVLGSDQCSLFEHYQDGRWIITPGPLKINADKKLLQCRTRNVTHCLGLIDNSKKRSLSISSSIETSPSKKILVAPMPDNTEDGDLLHSAPRGARSPWPFLYVCDMEQTFKKVSHLRMTLGMSAQAGFEQIMPAGIKWSSNQIALLRAHRGVSKLTPTPQSIYQAKRLIEDNVLVNWAWVLDDKPEISANGAASAVDVLMKEYISKKLFIVPKEFDLVEERHSPSPLSSLSSLGSNEDGGTGGATSPAMAEKELDCVIPGKNALSDNDSADSPSAEDSNMVKVYLLIRDQQMGRNLWWDKSHFLMSPSPKAIPTELVINALGDESHIRKRLGQLGFDVLCAQACISFSHRHMGSLDQRLTRRSESYAPLEPVETPLKEVPLAENDSENSDGKVWLTLMVKKYTKCVGITWQIFDRRIPEDFLSDGHMLEWEIDTAEPLVPAKKILDVAAQETELFKGPMVLLYDNPANKNNEEQLAQCMEESGAFTFLARKDADVNVKYVDTEDDWVVQLYIEDIAPVQKKRQGSGSPLLHQRPTARSKIHDRSSSSKSKSDSDSESEPLPANKTRVDTRKKRGIARNSAVEAWLLSKYDDDEVVSAIRAGARTVSEPICLLRVWVRKVADIVCDEVGEVCHGEGAGGKKITRTNVDHLLKRGKSWVSACVAAQKLIDRGVAEKDELLKMYLDPTNKDMTPFGAASLLKALVDVDSA